MQKLTRREFIRVSSVVTAGTVVAACAQPAPTEPAAVEPTTAPAATAAPQPAAPGEAARFSEAPMLTDLVSAGSLPPVEERLPVDPFVMAPRDEIGKYGQTWYSYMNPNYKNQAHNLLGFYEPAVTWNDDNTELIPNFLASFEPSTDRTTFTMTIRKGLRWSDGEPVTTEDVRFLYEDVWSNEAINPVFPRSMSAGGEPVQLNVVDDYTCDFVFSVAYPSWKYYICRPVDLVAPSHYLKQYHEAYVEKDDLDAMTQDAGFDTWNQLFTDKNQWKDNPDCPTLYAWKVESVSEDKLTRTYVRNPYYFKVDTEGNQLPYLDYLQVQYVENAETLKMITLTGDNEYIGAPIGEQFADWPIYAENAEEGNYRQITASSDFIHIFLVMPNSSSEDPQKGPILSNKDFRVALSHAINREELISLFMTVGDYRSKPAQQSPHEASPFYDEELTTQYTEYDVDKANELLDGMGLTERGADGYRLGLDGQPLQFVTLIPTYSPVWVDGGTLIAKYWREVGVNVEAKAVAPEIWHESVKANEIDISIHSTGSGGMLVVNSDGVDAYAVPYLGWMQRWCPGYANYVASDGAEGVEPPEFVWQMNELREKILAEPDEAKADEMVNELLGLWKENFPLIGICRPLPQWMLISNDLKNTPQDNEPWVIFMFGVGGNVDPCQFYKE